MTFALPDWAEDFVERQAARLRVTANDFFLDLIREAQGRMEESGLESLILEGCQGDQVICTEEWWGDFYERLTGQVPTAGKTMTRTVCLHPAVASDLERQAKIVGDRGPRFLTCFCNTVRDTLQALARYPEEGVLQNLRSPKLEGVWLMPTPGFERFSIFYRPAPDGVEVFRLLCRGLDYKILFEMEGD